MKTQHNLCYKYMYVKLSYQCEGCKDGPVMRVFTFHQCGPGFNPEPTIIIHALNWLHEFVLVPSLV